MNLLFRLLLTFNATSLLGIIFLVQKGYTLGYFFTKCPWLAELRLTFPFLDGLIALPNIVSYIAYLLVPILLTGLSILIRPLLGKDNFKAGQIVGIDHANNSFLPSYLGYFFVALSVGNWETLFFVYGVLFAFTFLSQALYFNPLFLLFGFEFYNVKTINGASIFLISRQKYKTPGEVSMEVAYRINNYTYIEKD